MKKLTKEKDVKSIEKKENVSITLSVRDRIILSELMSKVARGTFLEMLVTKHIIKKTSFTSEEIKALDIREEDGVIKWDAKVEKKHELAVDFTFQEYERINTIFQTVGSQPGSLTIEHIALWEKFGFDEPQLE